MKRRTELGAKLDKSVAIDDNGNVTAGHDLTVDGNIRVSRLVSDNNPEGDLLRVFKTLTSVTIGDGIGIRAITLGDRLRVIYYIYDSAGNITSMYHQDITKDQS